MLPPFHWWRTVFFLIPSIGLYTAILGAISITSALVGLPGRVAHGCARLWAWLILATTGVRVSVRGLERVPQHHSYLFIANHQSFYDIPILFWYVPFDLRIIAKASLRRVPFIGGHLARTGHVLVDRAKPGAAVFKQISDLMARGQSLIVFPEGTRSPDGRVGGFRSGIFSLGIEAGLPVVPVAVRGTRHIMHKGRLMTCPGVASVEVFDPIPTTGLTRDDAKALARRVQDIVEAGVEGDQDDPGRPLSSREPVGA
jgi:1-acyl-sn-glycerol-3-phosphate acyltransferase